MPARFDPSERVLPAAWVAGSLALLIVAWGVAQQFDHALARALFDWEGGRWALRDHVLVRGVVHKGGRWLGATVWLTVLAITAAHWTRDDARYWTRPAAQLLITVMTSALLVVWLKSVTRMDCPWDLVGLGGQRPFVPLFAPRPADLGNAACFPAAHAAGGYAWVALYFFFARTRPQWRWLGLCIGLAVGLVFGFGQQLRGAHFVSHDVASLTICWAIACGMDAVWVRLREGRRTAVAPTHTT